MSVRSLTEEQKQQLRSLFIRHSGNIKIISQEFTDLTPLQILDWHLRFGEAAGKARGVEAQGQCNTQRIDRSHTKYVLGRMETHPLRISSEARRAERKVKRQEKRFRKGAVLWWRQQPRALVKKVKNLFVLANWKHQTRRIYGTDVGYPIMFLLFKRLHLWLHETISKTVPFALNETDESHPNDPVVTRQAIQDALRDLQQEDPTKWGLSMPKSFALSVTAMYEKGLEHNRHRISHVLRGKRSLGRESISHSRRESRPQMEQYSEGADTREQIMSDSEQEND